MINKYMDEIQTAESENILNDIIERAAAEPEHVLTNSEYCMIYETAVNKARNWFNSNWGAER